MKFVKLCITISFTPLTALGASKALIESMHGENMLVEYQVLNSGRHVLVAKEKKPIAGAPFEQRQVVDLKLKRDEALATTYGFRCTRTSADFIYAVVAKKNAREKGAFTPERAWEVDEKSARLKPVTNTKSVTCTWDPEGEGDYNFR